MLLLLLFREAVDVVCPVFVVIVVLKKNNKMLIRFIHSHVMTNKCVLVYLENHSC